MTDLPALAAVSDLEHRLGVAEGSLQGFDLTRATLALSDASDLVRAESVGRTWLDSDGNPAPPPAVKVIVIQAALRAYNNPDNYTSESVGDYTYQREQGSTSIYLTDTELRTLAAAIQADGSTAAGWTGVGSVRVHSPYRWPTAYDPWREYGWRCYW